MNDISGIGGTRGISQIAGTDGKNMSAALSVAHLTITLLQNDKVFQIGLRDTGYGPDDFHWLREQGWTVIQAEECWAKPCGC